MAQLSDVHALLAFLALPAYTRWRQSIDEPTPFLRPDVIDMAASLGLVAYVQHVPIAGPRRGDVICAIPDVGPASVILSSAGRDVLLSLAASEAGDARQHDSLPPAATRGIN